MYGCSGIRRWKDWQWVSDCLRLGKGLEWRCGDAGVSQQDLRFQSISGALGTTLSYIASQLGQSVNIVVCVCLHVCHCVPDCVSLLKKSYVRPTMLLPCGGTMGTMWILTKGVKRVPFVSWNRLRRHKCTKSAALSSLCKVLTDISRNDSSVCSCVG